MRIHTLYIPHVHNVHTLYRGVHWNTVHHRQQKCRASWRLCWWFAGSSCSKTTAGIPWMLQTSIHSLYRIVHCNPVHPLHTIYRSVHCNPVHHRQRPKCRRASWRLCWWFAGSSRSSARRGCSSRTGSRGRSPRPRTRCPPARSGPSTA